MTFDEYQKNAERTDSYGGGQYKITDLAFLEKVLGASGETGELADKVKKILRNKNGVMSDDDKLELLKELGDVLWYTTMISVYLGSSIDEVAKMNVEKLADRFERGVINSTGDNR